ncbi:hypothetical protein Pfo_000619 [Paulownia fortunei]|nr:hypothetical protein Pfo_000619 [Paulownia fortunei]
MLGEYKAHCLILPNQLQGHINPMLQFSKRLAEKGIKITLAVTRYMFKAMQEFSSGSISVETISDGFDEGWKGDSAQNLQEYLARFQQVGTETLAELVEKLKNSGQALDCVIYDPFIPWSLDVAKKFGLVGAAFFTQSSSVNSIYYHVHEGQIKLPLSKNQVFNLPGLPPLEPSDMPSFLYDFGSYPGALELLVNQFNNIGKADWFFVNTFYKLEEEVTDWMARIWPVKTIGPTIPSMYLDKRLPDDKEYGLSVFKPTTDACMKWLNEHASKSVVYVSFGSMAELQAEQMEELAQALKLSDKYFLWVVRATEESKLPKNFSAEAFEKGLVMSWCPQLEVLAHDALGCFVTHCGWNSTLEALSLGVPLVAMPWWSDQSTNAKFVVDVWEMGIRARSDKKGIVRQEEIVRCIKHVMENEEGEEIRRSVKTWKGLAREAVDVGGTSDQNIEEFVSSLVARAPKVN